MLFVSGDETDLRYSVELCEEETIYLKERRKVVFEAMTSLLGDRAPRNPDEVCINNNYSNNNRIIILLNLYCACYIRICLHADYI